MLLLKERLIMLSKKILALTFCSFLSSFSAFEDPMAAYKASQNFIETHPDFPSKNAVMSCVQSPDKNISVGTGIAISPQYVLTAAHLYGLSDPASNVYVKDFGWIPQTEVIPPAREEEELDPKFWKGPELDVARIKKDPCFIGCKRFTFNKVTAPKESCTPLKDSDLLSEMDKITEHLRTTIPTNILRKASTIGNDIDAMLLQLERPLPGVFSIPLVPTSNNPKELNIYGIGAKNSWNFANEKKYWDEFKKNPPKEEPVFFAFKKGSFAEHPEDRLFVPHAITQTIRPIPGRPLAFSLFKQLTKGNDESFDSEKSTAYHKVSEEALPFFGTFTGGMSGGPVFAINEKNEFYLHGLISFSSPFSTEKMLCANFIQTFTPELVEKINKVMARPEAEAKPQ